MHYKDHDASRLRNQEESGAEKGIDNKFRSQEEIKLPNRNENSAGGLENISSPHSLHAPHDDKKSWDMMNELQHSGVINPPAFSYGPMRPSYLLNPVLGIPYVVPLMTYPYQFGQMPIINRPRFMTYATPYPNGLPMKSPQFLYPPPRNGDGM